MMRIVNLSSYYSRASSSSGRSFVRAAPRCSAPSSWTRRATFLPPSIHPPSIVDHFPSRFRFGANGLARIPIALARRRSSVAGECAGGDASSESAAGAGPWLRRSDVLARVLGVGSVGSPVSASAATGVPRSAASSSSSARFSSTTRANRSAEKKGRSIQANVGVELKGVSRS
jgi:hypothetical protein